jgi:hypothetical protein
MSMRPLRRRPSDSHPGSDALASRRVRSVLLGSYPGTSAEWSPIVASAKFVVYKADLFDEGEVKRSRYATGQGHVYRPDEMVRSEGDP